MTREIKFRIWNKTKKEMYFPEVFIFNIDWVHDINWSAWDSFTSHIKDNMMGNQEQSEIMQYTGIKDKNEKEIFEGDIVRYKWLRGSEGDCENEENYKNNPDAKTSIEVVSFEDGKFSPVPEYDYCDDDWYSYRSFDFEVIGNIYENPELLKEVNL